MRIEMNCSTESAAKFNVVIKMATSTATVCCQLCSLIFPHLRSYVSHLRQVHLEGPFSKLDCVVQDCPQSFRTFGALNTHVYRVHRNQLGLDTSSQPILHTEDEANVSVITPDYHCCSVGGVPDEIEYDVMQILGTDGSYQQREAAKFLLRLKEVRNMSDRAIADVIDGCKSLFTDSFSVVKVSIKDSLGRAGIDLSSIEGLESVFF